MTSKKTSGKSWTQMGNPESPAAPWQSLPHMFSHCCRVMAAAALVAFLSTWMASAQEMWTSSSSSSHAAVNRETLLTLKIFGQFYCAKYFWAKCGLMHIKLHIFLHIICQCKSYLRMNLTLHKLYGRYTQKKGLKTSITGIQYKT